MSWLLLSGLLALLSQVVVIRELAAALYGVELIYLVALAFWMLATAAGAALGRTRIPSDSLVVRLLATTGIWLLIVVVAVRSARTIFGAVPGAFLSFPLQLAIVAFAAGPLGGLLGLFFQLAATRAIANRFSPATAYAIEGAGALVAGLVVTGLLRLGASTMTLALGVSAVSLGVALSHAIGRAGRGAPWLRAGLAVALCAPLAFSTSLDRVLISWNHPDLIDVRDTPYSRIVVSGRAGQVTVFSDDALVADSESIAAELFAGLTALQHPAPGSALVLGGALTGVARELAAFTSGDVDCVELDRGAYEAARMSLAVEPALRSAQRVRVIFADPRAFVGSAGGGVYDLLLVATPDPSSGSASRFYTREFFAASARALSPSGVLGLQLSAAENLWTPALAEQVSSVYQALRQVFPHVVAIPGARLTLVASRQRLSLDPGVLASRMAERRTQRVALTAPFIRYLLTNDRQSEVTRLLDAGHAPVNTDVRPACYHFAMIVWLSKFYPRLAAVPADAIERWVRAAALAATVVAALAAILSRLFRSRREIRLLLLAAFAGAAGMFLETALLLHYQIVSGVVFQDIGLLIAAFMAGLAGGAVAIDRAQPIDSGTSLLRRYGLATVIGLALLSAASAWVMTGGGGRIETTALIGFSGALVGAVFGYAAARWPGDRARGLGALYAADLAGGAAATLLAALVVVPVGGLQATALAAVFLAALAAIVI